jgi:hypothetical protein
MKKNNNTFGLIFLATTFFMLYLLNLKFKREPNSYSSIFYLIYDIFYIPIFLTCGYVIGNLDFTIKTRIIIFLFFVSIVILTFIFLR